MTDVRTILIADDHPIFRQGLMQIVNKLPLYNVIAEAETGEAALTQFKYRQPDIILLDLAMPGMDGLEVLERMTRFETLPTVIVVTSYDDPEYLDRALELGARAYVLKDSAGEDLEACLRAVEEGQVYITPSLGHRKPTVPERSSKHSHDLQSLTPTERMVLTKVAEFKTSKEIAQDLNISFRTVQNHRANICAKLGLHGSHQLVAFARENSDLIRG
jgi:DNA-binding NarL/FixJ family response regulator